MFDLGSDNLNDEQLEAIRSENNILLIACPGSGKTRTLTYKIAYELSKLKSEKQNIIAITYTNRAADEIKSRIETLGVDTQQLWIGTIHSFCLEWILRPYSLYLNELKKGFRIINSHDTEKIITDLCDNYNLEHSLRGNNGISYWDFKFNSNSVPNYYATTSTLSKSSAINEIFTLYLNMLKHNRQVDFELILFYSYKLLIDMPQISKILANIFPYILVDEYQDTKELQYYILGKILSASNQNSSLFMVGDPNQSIFGSLGGYAIPKNTLETLTNLQIDQMTLTRNYRSSHRIVSYFNHYKTFSNMIEAHGVYADYESLITFNNMVDIDNLVNEIVRLVQFNIIDKNIQPSEIAILAPWWFHLLSLTRKLSSRLPEYNFDGPGLVPFSRDIDNFWFKLSKIALTEASPNMYIKRLRWAREVLKDLDNNHIDISNYSAKFFLRLCNSINIVENNGLNYLKSFFTELLHLLDLNIENHLYLFEHYEAFFDSSQLRMDRLVSEGIENATDIELFKKVFREKNGITISSIHGVKGAEFDTVIAFGLLEGIVPHFLDPNGEDSAKKQLYVIASRARKNLHLISERGRGRQRNTTNVLSQYTFAYN